MYRLPVSSCLLLACLLTQVGCATRETVVDAPTQRSWVEPGTPSNYFASTSAAKDELSFQLQATSCTNTEVTQLISDAREYKKSTFIAGPGLMIGGALAGAASVPVFASASENPATCAEDDEECVSEEDALATGYLLGSAQPASPSARTTPSKNRWFCAHGNKKPERPLASPRTALSRLRTSPWRWSSTIRSLAREQRTTTAG